MSTMPTVIASLTKVQCRRLLKIGKPFTYAPFNGVSVELDVWQTHVWKRLQDAEITGAQIIEAAEVKPRTNSTTKKCTECVVRDAGKLRVPSITIFPNGTVATRLEGCKRTEYTTLAAIYHMSVKARVMAERGDKARAKKARRA